MDNREKYLEQYYQAVIFLENKEDIKEALPTDDYSNFTYFIDGLIKKLNDEKQKVEEKPFSQEEFEELAKPEIQALEEKINICRAIKEEVEEEIQIEKAAEFVTKKELIFAKTDRGNIYVEEDLKDIPKEFYDTVSTCIYKLENNIQESNNEKAKSLTNNAKLKDVHSVKEWKVRLFYRHLTPDTAFVIIARMKKSYNDKKDMAPVIDRRKKTDDEFQELKRMMKDQETKQRIIEENRIIKERIKEKLNKKGRKKNG